MPDVVRSDNGAEFRGADTGYRKLLKKHRITAVFTAPYSPNMNGLCERFNSTSKN